MNISIYIYTLYIHSLVSWKLNVFQPSQGYPVHKLLNQGTHRVSFGSSAIGARQQQVIWKKYKRIPKMACDFGSGLRSFALIFQWTCLDSIQLVANSWSSFNDRFFGVSRWEWFGLDWAAWLFLAIYCIWHSRSTRRNPRKRESLLYNHLGEIDWILATGQNPFLAGKPGWSNDPDDFRPPTNSKLAHFEECWVNVSVQFSCSPARSWEFRAPASKTIDMNDGLQTKCCMLQGPKPIKHCIVLSQWLVARASKF